MIVPLGGERMERSREINRPSLGFHAILDMKDTSSAGRTHSCILDKVKGAVQNKLPQFRVLRVPSLQTSCKWPRLYRPYQMLVMNVDILNKISSNTP